MLRLIFWVLIWMMNSRDRNGFHYSWSWIRCLLMACPCLSLRIKCVNSCWHWRATPLLRLLKLWWKMGPKFWIVQWLIEVIVFKVHLSTSSSWWSQEICWRLAAFLSLIEIHVDRWIIVIYYTNCRAESTIWTVVVILDWRLALCKLWIIPIRRIHSLLLMYSI